MARHGVETGQPRAQIIYGPGYLPRKCYSHSRLSQPSHSFHSAAQSPFFLFKVHNSCEYPSFVALVFYCTCQPRLSRSMLFTVGEDNSNSFSLCPHTLEYSKPPTDFDLFPFPLRSSKKLAPSKKHKVAIWNTSEYPRVLNLNPLFTCDVATKHPPKQHIADKIL